APAGRASRLWYYELPEPSPPGTVFLPGAGDPPRASSDRGGRLPRGVWNPLCRRVSLRPRHHGPVQPSTPVSDRYLQLHGGRISDGQFHPAPDLKLVKP